MYFKLFRILFLSSLLLMAKASNADQLYDEIAELDKALFAAANAGNLEEIAVYFSKDLEFYHDTGGVDDYKGTLNNLAQLFSSAEHPKRTLVEGTMEVYPIKNYGAIQTGKHQFCSTQNDHQDCGTFAFTHVWEFSNEKWKITRVISYGH